MHTDTTTSTTTAVEYVAAETILGTIEAETLDEAVVMLSGLGETSDTAHVRIWLTGDPWPSIVADIDDETDLYGLVA